MYTSPTGIKSIALSLLALFILSGCSNGDASNAQSSSSTPAEQVFASGGDFAGSHILIAYSGAMRAAETVTRSKEEALAKAQELITKLNEDPGQFEELAQTESDGPSASNGGSLGTWQKGQMVPAFDTAVENMEVGKITTEPVETDFGYHIIRRDDIPKVAHYGADAFIIGYTGTPNTPETVTRDSAAAAVLAEEIKGKLSGDNFEELANEYNDFGEGPMFIGVFREGDPMPPGLIESLKEVGFGQTAGPIQLPVGFAFVRRMELIQRAGSHILIAYSGAMRANPTIERTKEEAEAEAKRILEMIKADPDKFEELAAEHSDGPTGPDGGDLGKWFKGSMVPEFDTAIDDLDEGEIFATPVETDFGYHIIRRNEIED